MDLQGFGFNVYLSQLVFGAVDIPAKLLSVLVISCLGRRAAQSGSLALAGLCILANIFVPSGGSGRREQGGTEEDGGRAVRDPRWDEGSLGG